jgi:hypothetical protein
MSEGNESLDEIDDEELREAAGEWQEYARVEGHGIGAA